MSITLYFLKAQITVPDDLMEYLGLLDFTAGIQRELNATCMDFAQNSANRIAEVAAIRGELEKQAGMIICKLCDHGIFDRTIDTSI